MEVKLVILVGIICFWHPSMNALKTFWAYLLLIWPMTKDIKVRYKWNIIILLIILAIQAFLVFYKKKIADDLNLSKDPNQFNTKDEYAKSVKKLLVLGFSFGYDFGILHSVDSELYKNVSAPFIIHGYDKFSSYNVEIISTVLNLAMIIFSLIQDRRIAYLQSVETEKFELLSRLLMPKEDSNETSVDDEVTIGANSEAINYKERKKKEAEMKK